MSVMDDAMLFVEVARAGSFTQTAVNHQSSKSQISRRIAQLEQRLNAQLFIRTPRQLQLTEAGHQFFQSCLKIQGDFLAATEVLKQTHDDVSGKISMTCPMTLGTEVIGPLLAKFLCLYPKVSLELDLSDNVHNFVESHFDIAIRAAKSLPDSALKAHKLLTYKYIICASPAYLEEYGTPKQPSELKAQGHRSIVCINREAGLGQGKWPFVIDGQEQQLDIHSIAEVTHMKVQQTMALEGVGMIRVPEYWVRHFIEEGRLISLLAEYQPFESHLFVVYRDMKNQPKRIKEVIDYMDSHFCDGF
ncbi:LysR family transcriptional regulator [Piscirickettsia litoralis]|uniref:HTH lysR-type domain-containing protein n=1 Tax=Piscirickettsia litoralis TaxID=1891921 RepID=A0ABX3A1B4_9GAMM|nr:LysR family transcriptional regulator [Piscirickettsia litoralis]ODN42613.1 hypothetical protein BGC07_06330 [Piscirickettsia litoralis]